MAETPSAPRDVFTPVQGSSKVYQTKYGTGNRGLPAQRSMARGGDISHGAGGGAFPHSPSSGRRRKH